MRYFCAFVFGVIFHAFSLSAQAQSPGTWHMAFCTDGDGALTEWVPSRDDAVIAGRDHEKASRGHRWEIFVQTGKVAVKTPGCAAIGDDPNRPDTVRVVNTCGTCRIIKVTRRHADGTSKSKEFQVKPKSTRRFLKRPDSEIVVEGEFECPDS